MTNSKTYKQLTSISLGLLLSACSVVQTPDYSSQASDFNEHQLQQHESFWTNSQQAISPTPSTNEAPSDLLSLIDMPQLEESIQLGLAANPSVLQTAIALQISSANITTASADQYPNANLTITGNEAEHAKTTYNVELGVSWTVDIWGKISDGVDAAEANLVSSQASYQGARDLLASQIISLHLQLIQQEQLIDIKEEQLGVLESNEEAIVERYKKGLSDLTDLDAARSNSESSRADLASNQELLKVLQRNLSLLMAGKKQPKDLAKVKVFPSVLVPVTTLPDQDLSRRPDLQKAYADISAAEANSRVAYKSLLPSFSLQAALTDSSTNLTDALFNSASWNLLGQITAPLFQAGKLRAQAEIAQLQAEQSYLIYQDTLLTAVNEVENALGQEISLTKQQDHIQAALSNAQRSFSLYQDKYRQGLATFLELTQVQSQTFSLQIQLTQLIYQRLNNRITLGLALGLGAPQ